MVSYLKRDNYPSKDYLDECFYYDLISGNLIWRERPRHHFKTESAMKCTNSRWFGKCAGTKTYKGYLRVKINEHTLFIHRIVFIMLHGYNPENLIDHKNMNKLCNMYWNLREVSPSCNSRNCKVSKNNTTPVTGVHVNKNKYRASITVKGKRKALGVYSSLDKAVIARWLAEQELSWNSCQEESSAYRYLYNKGLVDTRGLTNTGLVVQYKYENIESITCNYKKSKGKKVIINNIIYESVHSATKRVLEDYPDKNYDTVRKELRNIVSGKRKEGYMYGTLEVRRHT